MPTRRLLPHLATLAVAVALGAHLLMQLQPHPGGGAQPVGMHAEHRPTMSVLAGADGSGHADVHHGHLMAALCMAVLAAAALTIAVGLVGRTASAHALLPSAARRVVGSRVRAPPSAPSRIDAGVLLRV